jgi:thiamine pyrophosphate-dependent acetolactate synthase large subunit-like protein
MQASAEIRELLGTADLLIAFGCSLDHFQVSHGELYTKARVIHVDLDPSRIGERADVDLGLIGDSETVARALLAHTEELTPEILATTRTNAAGWRTSEMQHRLAMLDRWADCDFTEQPGVANQYAVMRACDERLPANRQVVIDCGQSMAPPAAFISIGRDGQMILPWEFGLVGNCLGPAIGAAVGRPDRYTVAFVGDGGLMLGLPDLDTPVRYNLPFLIVLSDDGSLSAERRLAKLRGEDPDLSDYGSPDYAGVARAMGYDAFTVGSTEDMETALDAVKPERQSFIRVLLDKDRSVPEYGRSMQGWGW